MAPASPIAHRWLLLLLFAAAAFLRLWGLEQYPLTVNQDELSNVYDAYCLSRNGCDRWGEHLPLTLKGFGGEDYRAPMMAWLGSVPSYVAGFTVGGVRLVSALLGIGSLWLLYLFCKRWRDADFALLATFIAAFSPWHIQYSRLAHEGAMLPVFCCILLLYLWQRAHVEVRAGGWTVLTGLCAGLSLLSYHSAKGLLPVFVLLFVADAFRSRQLNGRRVLYFLVPLLAGMAPALLALYRQPYASLARIRGQQIIAADMGYWLREFIANYARNLSPRYLFLSSGEGNNLTLARLLPIELPFFYGGMALLLLRRNRAETLSGRYLLLFAAGTLLAACLAYANPHALRSSMFCIIAPIFTVTGVMALTQWLPSRKKFIVPFLAVLIAGNSLWLIRQYVHTPALRNFHQQHAFVLAAQRLGVWQSRYDTVYVTNTPAQPELYVQAYTALPPDALYALPMEAEPKRFLQFRRLGKFLFRSPADMQKETATAPDRVLWLSEKKLPYTRCFDSVSFNGQCYYFCDK